MNLPCQPGARLLLAGPAQRLLRRNWARALREGNQRAGLRLPAHGFARLLRRLEPLPDSRPGSAEPQRHGIRVLQQIEGELDKVLSEFDRSPSAGKWARPRRCLSQIRLNADAGEDTGASVRVSYLNDLDPRKLLDHMLVSPGSSFPAIAARSRPSLSCSFPSRT